MPKPLIVFGVNYDGQHRMIVAAKTMTEAARLMGLPYSQVKIFGSQTWNERQIQVAMTEPGATFYQRCNSMQGTEWKKGKPQ